MVATPSRPWTFLTLLPSSWNSNGINNRAAVWLFQYFLPGQEKSSHTVRLGRPNDQPNKEINLMTYGQLINHLLSTYAADDIIAEARIAHSMCTNRQDDGLSVRTALIEKSASDGINIPGTSPQVVVNRLTDVLYSTKCTNLLDIEHRQWPSHSPAIPKFNFLAITWR